MAFKGLRGIFNLDKGQDDDYIDDDYDSFDEFDDEDEEPEVKKSFKERFTSKASKKEEYDDEDEYDSYDDFDEPPVKEVPEKKKIKPVAKVTESFSKKTSESRVINMSRTNNYSNSAGQIYMLKPKKIDDAKSAVDALLSGKVVILNLEGIALELAQSVTDFISGASYCISGNFSTISQNVFVYTPNGYDLTGAFDEEFLGTNLRDY